VRHRLQRRDETYCAAPLLTKSQTTWPAPRSSTSLSSVYIVPGTPQLTPLRFWSPPTVSGTPISISECHVDPPWPPSPISRLQPPDALPLHSLGCRIAWNDPPSSLCRFRRPPLAISSATSFRTSPVSPLRTYPSDAIPLAFSDATSPEEPPLALQPFLEPPACFRCPLRENRVPRHADLAPTPPSCLPPPDAIPLYSRGATLPKNTPITPNNLEAPSERLKSLTDTPKSLTSAPKA
jgi:hypothetical protein